jgi:flagellar protein FlaD
MAGLFRKKPAKDDAPTRRKLRDLEEEYEGEAEEAFEETEPGMPSDEEEDYLGEDIANGGGLTGVKELSEMLGRFEEVEDKMGRIDSALTTERNENAKVRDRLNQMEQDIKKLLSVYEVVSTKFNPFIDVSDKEPPEKAPSPPVAFEAAPLPDFDLGEDIPEFKPYQEGEVEPPSFKEKVARAGRDTAPWEPGTSTAAVEAVQKGLKREPPPMMDKTSKDEKYEREMRAAARSKHNKKPLLAYIPHDYLTLVLVMRWIEFLFERVTRDKISLVLDYYVDVGWISEDVKSEIMSYARGEMQDVTKYMGHEEVREEVFRELPAPSAAPYKKVEDWRLSADDHLKSLLFVQKIAGLEVDKDRLNSLEQNISKFKETLEGFHGV